MGQPSSRAAPIRYQCVNHGGLAYPAMTHRAQTWTFLIASNLAFWVWFWHTVV
jgi:hypothetical protein